ncbi:hypothetical protein [Mycobacterium noviomagense]|uniref:hypothetical protein n=1 Tax=Mycobacterium noviomagense TaxID=459858 RepID=UPI0021F2E13C|nr:hypothetical protein [Mycobacterium noviomagense]
MTAAGVEHVAVYLAVIDQNGQLGRRLSDAPRGRHVLPVCGVPIHCWLRHASSSTVWLLHLMTAALDANGV